ncbi:DUF2911 domain-containing protein [Ekhidna sp.]|uniref:DUF2911 domain-containing protein n=1 Tax=Ekhidna sp. TaxID=2608089 RepID=UPI0032EAB375
MKSEFRIRTIIRSKSTILCAISAFAWIGYGCSSDPQNRPSPLRSDSATVHGVKAYVEFSSPGVKNRQIFGYGADFLVPYGEMWRTGANHATYVSFTDKILVDSMELDSGTYSIFTIPTDTLWTFILNQEWDQWGSYSYKDSLDVMRLNIKPRYADQSQERMLFYFAEDSLKFRWDKVRWAIPLNPLREELR